MSIDSKFSTAAERSFVENRFLWGIVMAQLTSARFRGDTTFGFLTRILSTFLGGLVGLCIWWASFLFEFLSLELQLSVMKVYLRPDYRPSRNSVRARRDIRILFPVLFLYSIIHPWSTYENINIFRDHCAGQILSSLSSHE